MTAAATARVRRLVVSATPCFLLLALLSAVLLAFLRPVFVADLPSAAASSSFGSSPRADAPSSFGTGDDDCGTRSFGSFAVVAPSPVVPPSGRSGREEFVRHFFVAVPAAVPSRDTS